MKLTTDARLTIWSSCGRAAEEALIGHYVNAYSKEAVVPHDERAMEELRRAAEAAGFTLVPIPALEAAE